MTGTSGKSGPDADAKGQFAKSQGDPKASGVHSAKPTVITGSEDATAHRNPPGQKKPDKDFSPNYDERDMNEGSFRG